MTLATGKQFAKQPASRVGFTLVEIVLVLGLMALASTLVIMNIDTLISRGDDRSTEDILQSAVRNARFIAASERTVTELRFDKETGSLTISSESGSAEPFQLNDSFKREGPAQIEFYLVPPAEGLSTAPDASRTRLETDHVKFAPDRSASPFVVDINLGSGTPTRMIFDPFSSLLITPK